MTDQFELLAWFFAGAVFSFPLAHLIGRWHQGKKNAALLKSLEEHAEAARLKNQEYDFLAKALRSAATGAGVGTGLGKPLVHRFCFIPECRIQVPHNHVNDWKKRMDEDKKP
jgi:hypothetical protein